MNQKNLRYASPFNWSHRIRVQSTDNCVNVHEGVWTVSLHGIRNHFVPIQYSSIVILHLMCNRDCFLHESAVSIIKDKVLRNKRTSLSCLSILNNKHLKIYPMFHDSRSVIWDLRDSLKIFEIKKIKKFVVLHEKMTRRSVKMSEALWRWRLIICTFVLRSVVQYPLHWHIQNVLWRVIPISHTLQNTLITRTNSLCHNPLHNYHLSGRKYHILGGKARTSIITKWENYTLLV